MPIVSTISYIFARNYKLYFKYSSKLNFMKIKRNFLLFISLLLLAQFSFAQANNSKKIVRYGVKSGIVEYKKTIEGKVLVSKVSGSGSQALYFKDWGNIEVQTEESSQTTKTKFFGKKSEKTTNIHTMAKLDNGMSYGVNFENKTISKRKDMAMEMVRNSDHDAYYVGEQLLIDMGGEKVGKEEYLGYQCDKWKIPGGYQLMYKGVILKFDMKVLGIRTLQEATSAKFDIDVPDKFFKLPDFKELN